MRLVRLSVVLSCVSCLSFLHAKDASAQGIDAEIAKNQQLIDGIRAGARIIQQTARDRAARGECEEFYGGIATLRRQARSIPKNERYQSLPPATRDDLAADTKQLADALATLPCPPPRTAAAAVKVEGNLSVLNGINVSNGGLGGNRNVTRTGVEVGGSFGNTFIYTSGDWGRMDQDLGAFGTSPSSRVFLQPNGGTQVVPGAAVGTGGKTEVSTRQFGAGVQFGTGMPIVLPWGSSLSPFIGFGVEQREQDTRLRAEFSTIAFTIVDDREVDTTRVHLRGGGTLAMPMTPDTQLFLRGHAQLNTDFVRGQGTYFTQQIGVFSETVTSSTSRVGVTGSGKLALGVTSRFFNGPRVEWSVFGAIDPHWQLLYREGQPATLSPEYKGIYGGTVALHFPLDPVFGFLGKRPPRFFGPP
jgi:hypothetical protein